MQKLSRIVSGLAVVCAGVMAGTGAWAQSDRQLRLVVPLSPGSASDTVARALSPELAKSLSRPVVVENLTGANGTTGTVQVVRAKDDRTLGVVATGHVINPFLYKSMPYDALKDVTPVSVLAASPLVLVVHPSVAAQNLRELIALGKAKPEALTYGSAGNGSIAHLATALFTSEAGIKVRHVPYRGVAQLLTDLIGGHVQMAFVGVSVAQSQVAAGKLRAMAVTSAQRSPQMPNVPTIAEGGLPGFAYEPWIAVIAPADLPAGVASGYAAALRSALDTPAVNQALGAQGFRTIGNSPEQAKAFFAAELARHEKLVKESGAVME